MIHISRYANWRFNAWGSTYKYLGIDIDVSFYVTQSYVVDIHAPITSKQIRLEVSYILHIALRITALASATVVFIECMSMAFAYEYDHDLSVK